METIFKKKPAFVARKVALEDAKKLIEFGKELGLTSTLPADDMHMTVVFSKMPVVWQDLELDTKKVKVSFSGLKVFGKENNVLVLAINDYPYLRERNKYFLDMGASSDFPDYKAHVTLSWKIADLDIDMSKNFEGQVTLEEEYIDDIIDTTNYEPKEEFTQA